MRIKVNWWGMAIIFAVIIAWIGIFGFKSYLKPSSTVCVSTTRGPTAYSAPLYSHYSIIPTIEGPIIRSAKAPIFREIW